MKIKPFVVATLVGMAVANVAHAQSWERREADEYNPFPVVEAAASNDGYFSFYCHGQPEEAVAAFSVSFPADKVREDFEDGNVVRAFIDVDGERTEWRLDFIVIGDGDVVGFTSKGDPRLDVEVGSEPQVNLAYALQSGQQATLTIPMLNITSRLGLGGSMDALESVYLGCGMVRPTGTGVWTEDEYDLNGTD